jgi:hypothetical protein
MDSPPSNRSIIVMTRNFEPLCKTSPEKAFCLIYSDRAVGYSFASEQFNNFVTLRTVSGEYYVPKIIVLKSNFGMSFFLKRKIVQPTKRNIFSRDSNKCGYCGKKATTLDHVVPTSKGGQNTWDNLVAACHHCNNSKGDKAPEEVGLKLIHAKLKSVTPQEYSGKMLNEFLEIIEKDASYGS